MAKRFVSLLLGTMAATALLSGCSSGAVNGVRQIAGSETSVGETYESGLTIVPSLMQTPRALAFFRVAKDNTTPNDAWQVTRLDHGIEELGHTWGSYLINDESGTGKGPAKDGEGFEIASVDLAVRAGDEIPILFDFRGLEPGQKIRINDGFGTQAEFFVSKQENSFESPARLDLCNSEMDLPPEAILQRIDEPVPGEPFHKSRCSEIPSGVYEIRLGRKLLTYVRR